MKSAHLIAHEADLFARIVRALPLVTAEQVHQTPDNAQFIEDGRLFNLFREDDEYLPELRSGEFRFETDSPAPDMSSIYACYVECRWDRWFIEIVGRLHGVLDFPFWVLDSDDTVWRPDSIDPDGLVL